MEASQHPPMSPDNGVPRYLELNYQQIQQLDRLHTIFFSALSPVETHGPHLPVGTDILVAAGLRDRIIQRVQISLPDYGPVILPTLALGAFPIKVPGSLQLRPSLVEGVLKDWGWSLRQQGFRYWLLCDNHGDPHHQIAIERAARWLRRHDFLLIAPFNAIFRKMMSTDPEIEARTGLPPGSYGDFSDAHAGTNETSLMLALHPELIHPSWRTLGAARVSPVTWRCHLLRLVGQVLQKIGLHEMGNDLVLAAQGLAWVSDPEMASYQGAPCHATQAAGEKMLDYFTDISMALLKQALQGKLPPGRPFLWSLRCLRHLL